MERGHFEIARFLLDNGAQIEAKNATGSTALHYAVFRGHIEFAKFLMDYGAQNVADGNGWTPLQYAANRGNLDFVKFLIDHGAQLEFKNVEGRIPLHYAVMQATMQGHLEVAKFLIDRGTKIEAKDNFGNNSLHNAAFNGSLEMVKLLVENGIQIDARNNLSATPFDISSRENHNEVANYLLEKKREAENQSPEIVSTNAVCIVCWEERGGLYVLNPCGHTSLCELCCFNLIKKRYPCPTCRKPIDSYIKMFFQAPEDAFSST